MGRSKPAKDVLGASEAQSTEAYSKARTDIGQAEADQTKLRSGLDVGQNPFETTRYLSNVNKLQSEALGGAAESSKGEMARRLKATGGLNASQTVLGQRDVGLQTGRLADTLSAQRAAQDYKANLMWQQYLAQQPLSRAEMESRLYGTASGVEGNALNNLTQLSGQKYGFWGGIIDSALQGAGTGAGLAAACWIAEAIYGTDDARTHLLRSWLNREFEERWYGRVVMAGYRRFGQSIAGAIRRFRPLGWVFRPLFDLALLRACWDRRRPPLGVV
jgi:hypothetical protein